MPSFPLLHSSLFHASSGLDDPVVYSYLDVAAGRMKEVHKKRLYLMISLATICSFSSANILNWIFF